MRMRWRSAAPIIACIAFADSAAAMGVALTGLYQKSFYTLPPSGRCGSAAWLGCAGSVGSSRFDQPPPNAWNNAAVSMRRLAWPGRARAAPAGRRAGDQHDDIGRVADVEAAAGDGEAGRRRPLGGDGRLQRLRVILERGHVSATLRKAVRTGDRYWAWACSSQTCAARFSACSAPPSSSVRMEPALTIPLAGPTAGRNSQPRSAPVSRRSPTGPSAALGGDRDADLARGRMDAGLGGADVGRCRPAGAGRLSGRSAGSFRSSSSKFSAAPCWRGCRSGWRAGRVAGPAPSARAAGCLGLRQRCLLAGDVGAGDGAETGLALQDAERLALGGDDALGRRDLGAQRGLGDRRHDHVGASASKRPRA